MMKKVNRNFIWCEVFVRKLVQLGVKYVCISPGSRSAPLTFSFAQNKSIKCFVHIDERSSAFFALGLAKASGSPVVVVTTSGTAAAELYPAIIEAYQQRIPMLICTADRPPELKYSGAIQMINQKNIYKNHIRWFKDAGLPELSEKKLSRLLFITQKAFETAFKKDKGPVHINFPFRKPLEPDSVTDEIEDELINSIINSFSVNPETGNEFLKKKERKSVQKAAERILTSPKGLIVAGPQDYNPEVRTAIISLAAITGYPLLADGASQLRYFSYDKLIIKNYDAFLNSTNFKEKFKPDLILQFGRTVTSSSLENYFEEIESDRLLINEFGDRFDPSGKANSIIKINPGTFCNELIKFLGQIKFNNPEKDWTILFQKADEITEKIKSKLIFNAEFRSESRIIPEIIKAVPSKSSLMIGNSLPIRDLDSFAGSDEKDLKIFFNRGASGIDGITSTAMGIAKHNKSAVLVTGDLSFLHDLNALLIPKQSPVQLVIILINNNGGGIFESLPISKEKKIFKKYFKTPHNQNIQNLVESLGLSYIRIESWKHLNESITVSMQKKSLAVLEIKTNSFSSHTLREKYWTQVTENINSEFN